MVSNGEFYTILRFEKEVLGLYNSLGMVFFYSINRIIKVVLITSL